MTPLWLAAIPAALALGLWAMLDLQRFVLLPLLGTMIFPFALATPASTEIALADLLLLLALAAWLVSGSVRAAPGPWLAGNRMLVPTLLFVGINLQSLAWSIRPHDTVVFAIQLIEIVVVFPLVFASLPRSLAEIRRGLMLYLGLTCFVAAVTALLYVPRALGGDVEGHDLLGLSKNAIGSFLAAGMVIAYALWLCEGRGGKRRMLALAAIVELVGLFSTVSRGSIIGAFFAMIAVSLLLRRRRLLTLTVAAASAVLFLATIGVHSGVDRSLQGSYDSSVVRSYSFSNAVEKIRERPLLGTGAGTYQDEIPQLEITLPDPNNMLLLTWAELGIVGLVALLLLLYRFARLLLETRRIPDPAAGPAVAAGAVALSFLVHFQLDVTWTRGTTSLAFSMIGLMLAVQRLSSAPALAEAPATNRSARRPLSSAPAHAG